MLKQTIIYFIFAEDCKDCEDMRSTINDAIEKSSYRKENCTIIEMNSSCDEAVDLAVDNDIDDLPACIIGGYSFCGKNGYTFDSILRAIEKTWEDDAEDKGL